MAFRLSKSKMNDWPGIRLLQWCKEYRKENIMDGEFLREDRELLVRIDERLKRLEKWAYNHDTHHLRYNLLAWSVALGAIVSLVITVIKVL